jgi:hypothetical protein
MRSPGSQSVGCHFTTPDNKSIRAIIGPQNTLSKKISYFFKKIAQAKESAFLTPQFSTFLPLHPELAFSPEHSRTGETKDLISILDTGCSMLDARCWMPVIAKSKTTRQSLVNSMICRCPDNLPPDSLIT